MCGITGIWHWNEVPVKRDILQDFTSALKHRGPDGEGFYVNNSETFGLGHRRLAILDPTKRGSQPMHFANKRYWLTFNGEIFNFIELKQNLKALGYHFKSDCDSEIILAAYNYWGASCLKKFNGMWALAIWDSVEQELFLARDRYGIKPLFFAKQHGRFAFASETYAFNFLKDFDKEIDKQKLSRSIYNASSLEGSGHTIYKDVFQLLPGHFLKIKKRDSIQQTCWWSWPKPGSSSNLPYDEQIEKFKIIFTEACKIRMRSDVPIASALSGGVDSSSIYTMLHHLKTHNKLDIRSPDVWQKAFVASFPGTSQDETHFATEVIDHTNGKVDYVEPNKNNLLDGWIDSTLKYDAVAGSPNFVVASVYKEMSRQGYKVSMDGHGVDEMMFGYHGMVQQAANAVKENNLKQLHKELDDILQAMYYKNTGYNQTALQKMLSLLRKSGITQMGRTITSKKTRRNIKQLFSGNPASTPSKWLSIDPNFTLKNLSEKNRSLKKYDQFEQIIIANFYLTTLPKILANFDRASMQNSLEIRMPFMDYNLVEYVFSLPVSSKLGNGFTKRILRDAMKGILPESIRTRKLKIGFTTPMHNWFAGNLSEPLLDFTHSKDFLENDIWDGPQLRDFVEDRIKNDSWTLGEGFDVWPFINAYILMSK